MGLIFIELLVGQRVFTYDSFYKVMIDINMGFEIPLSISNPVLRTILTQSTALDPAERYATCHEFAEDLKAFMRNDLSQQSAGSAVISPLDNPSLDNPSFNNPSLYSSFDNPSLDNYSLDNPSLDNHSFDNTSLDNKAETPTTARLSITDIMANSGK